MKLVEIFPFWEHWEYLFYQAVKLTLESGLRSGDGVEWGEGLAFTSSTQCIRQVHGQWAWTDEPRGKSPGELVGSYWLRGVCLDPGDGEWGFWAQVCTKAKVRSSGPSLSFGFDLTHFSSFGGMGNIG